MKVLVVFDHPRHDSFCGAVLDQFGAGLSEAGHLVEIADLRAENFDPRMPIADEPEWDNADKVYSEAVLAEQRRVERNDALAFVFPVFWWSFPATTKGWIDRVWNYGWAYGERKLHHSKALLIGVNAGDEAGYRKRDYDKAMRVQLLTGIIDYCGIRTGSLELFYDALESEQRRGELLDRAKRLGLSF
jgi:NAD(P)H dehydrogenase (quinone)